MLLGIGLIGDWLHGSSIRSVQDLGLQDILVSMYHRATPHGDKLPTGCGGCMHKMAMESPATLITTIPKERNLRLTWVASEKA